MCINIPLCRVSWGRQPECVGEHVRQIKQYYMGGRVKALRPPRLLSEKKRELQFGPLNS